MARTPDSVGLWRIGGDHRTGIESHRRAHDRADIVGIGDLVEHQNQRAVLSESSLRTGRGRVSSMTPWWIASGPRILSISCGETISTGNLASSSSSSSRRTSALLRDLQRKLDAACVRGCRARRLTVWMP